MKIIALVALTLVLGACAPLQQPIVDMEGVDPVALNRDLAECNRNKPAIAWGNPLKTCMSDKGYKVLETRPGFSG